MGNLKEKENCFDAIKQYIDENFDGRTFKKNDNLKDVIQKFGEDTMEIVLACNVSDFDGRFSQDNKDWAAKIVRRIDVDPYYLQGLGHAGLVNVVVNKYHKAKEEVKAEKSEFSLQQMNEMKKELQTDSKETKNKTHER